MRGRANINRIPNGPNSYPALPKTKVTALTTAILVLITFIVAHLHNASVTQAAPNQKCSPTQIRHKKIIEQNKTQLETLNTPTTLAALELAARAADQCSRTQLAAAITTAATQQPAPTKNSRHYTHGLYLVAREKSNQIIWQHDALKQAQRLQKYKGKKHEKLFREQLQNAKRGVTRITWSEDSTKKQADPLLSSQIALILAKRPTKIDRGIAVRTIRAFETKQTNVQLRKLPASQQVQISTNLARTARLTKTRRENIIAKKVAINSYWHVRKATHSGWSRSGNKWSTKKQHQQLITQVTLLLKYYPHKLTNKTLKQLKIQLKKPAKIRFVALPEAGFYPWPKNGIQDSQNVQIKTDKPAKAALQIYDETNTLIKTVEQYVNPDNGNVEWDGTNDIGEVVAPGIYRYAVQLRDLANNPIRVPGLGSFKVLRDTEPPTVIKNEITYQTKGTIGPRLIIAWEVKEELSPGVTTNLILDGPNGQTLTFLIDKQSHSARKRKLAKLTNGEWKATLQFIDGAENSRKAPPISIKVK